MKGVYQRSPDTLAKIRAMNADYQRVRTAMAYSDKPCETCGELFTSRTKLNRRFCSNRCKTLKQFEDPRNHPSYKGEDGNTPATHRWINKVRGGRPWICEGCGAEPESAADGRAKIHWANLSGEYRRDPNDWAALCIPCHWAHDQPWLKRLRTNGVFASYLGEHM